MTVSPPLPCCSPWELTPPYPCSPVFKSKVFYVPFGVPICVLISVWFSFNLGCGKEDGRGVLRPGLPVMLGWGCFSSPPGMREVQGHWQGRDSSLSQQPRAIPNRCLCICCSSSHLGTPALEVLRRNQGGCRWRLQSLAEPSVSLGRHIRSLSWLSCQWDSDQRGCAVAQRSPIAAFRIPGLTRVTWTAFGIERLCFGSSIS